MVVFAEMVWKMMMFEAPQAQGAQNRFPKLSSSLGLWQSAVDEGLQLYASVLQALRTPKRISRPTEAHDGPIYGLCTNSCAAPSERRHG